MGTRATNAAGCLLTALFLARCAAVPAYGLVAALLTSTVHGGTCPPAATSLAEGTCPAPSPPATTPP